MSDSVDSRRHSRCVRQAGFRQHRSRRSLADVSDRSCHLWMRTGDTSCPPYHRRRQRVYDSSPVSLSCNSSCLEWSDEQSLQLTKEKWQGILIGKRLHDDAYLFVSVSLYFYMAFLHFSSLALFFVFVSNNENKDDSRRASSTRRKHAGKRKTSSDLLGTNLAGFFAVRVEHRRCSLLTNPPFFLYFDKPVMFD